MKSIRRWGMALALFAGATSGCAHTVKMPMGALPAEEARRLAEPEGRKVCGYTTTDRVANRFDGFARLDGDSLRLFVPSGSDRASAEGESRGSMRFADAKSKLEIESLHVRKFSAVRTTILVGGIAAVAVLSTYGVRALQEAVAESESGWFQ